MKTLALLLLLCLVALPVTALAGPETIVVDAPALVTACELEQGTINPDLSVTWRVLAPQAVPAASKCTFTVNAPAGRALYRWAYISGTTRALRTDGGVFLCLGLADCPLLPVNVGLQ